MILSSSFNFHLCECCVSFPFDVAPPFCDTFCRLVLFFSNLFLLYPSFFFTFEDDYSLSAISLNKTKKKTIFGLIFTSNVSHVFLKEERPLLFSRYLYYLCVCVYFTWRKKKVCCVRAIKFLCVCACVPLSTFSFRLFFRRCNQYGNTETRLQKLCYVFFVFQTGNEDKARRKKKKTPTLFIIIVFFQEISLRKKASFHVLPFLSVCSSILYIYYVWCVSDINYINLQL